MITYLLINLSINNQSTYFSIYQYINHSTYLSICLSIYRFFFLSIYLLILSIYLSTCLFIYSYIFPSINLFIYPYLLHNIVYIQGIPRYIFSLFFFLRKDQFRQLLTRKSRNEEHQQPAGGNDNYRNDKRGVRTPTPSQTPSHTLTHTDTHTDKYRAKMLGHRRRRRVSTWSLSPSLSSLSISRNFYTHMERKLNYPQQIELAGTGHRYNSVC